MCQRKQQEGKNEDLNDKSQIPWIKQVKEHGEYKPNSKKEGDLEE